MVRVRDCKKLSSNQGTYLSVSIMALSFSLLAPASKSSTFRTVSFALFNSSALGRCARRACKDRIWSFNWIWWIPSNGCGQSKHEILAWWTNSAVFPIRRVQITSEALYIVWMGTPALTEAAQFVDSGRVESIVAARSTSRRHCWVQQRSRMPKVGCVNKWLTVFGRK